MRAERTLSGVSGAIACRGGMRLVVDVDGAAIPNGEMEGSRAGSIDLFRFRWDLSPTASARVEARIGRHATAVTLPPATMPFGRPSSRQGTVSVVVPIHGGRDATRACLAALAAQSCRLAIDVIVIDDACPDADMADEVAVIAHRWGWRLLSNRINLGFAAAVNAAASIAAGSHLLLLNADAILPPGAIDRLLSAAAEPTVGTVVPFSNDGGFTSFPILRKVNPAPDAAESLRIDDAARGIDTKRAIDIPAGTAFCMLVTGPCWDALQGLDLAYGRGYYEDIDFCLRAKRLGFRNVLAPDLYVRHLGGQSFGAEKRGLVARNARLLVERFPDYDAEWMAFAEADPLAAIRGDIERRLPPEGPIGLIAGQPLQRFAASRPAPGGTVERRTRVLALSEDGKGGRLLRSVNEGVPQSLRFAVGEVSELSRYLRALDIDGVTLVEPSDALLRDLGALLLRPPLVSVAPTGPDALRLLRSLPGSLTHDRVVGLDRMARAALGFDADPLPASQASRRGPPRVAALVPRPTISTDRLLFALDRRLRPHGGEVVIFGAAIGGRARPKATGAMDSGDYVDALRHGDITHVLLPDARSDFGIIEDLRRSSPVPAAYIDWSEGGHRAAQGDLALDDGSDEADRVAALLTWCLGDTPTERVSA